MTAPYVSSRPGMKGGAHTINGTRIPADILAEMVSAGEPVDHVSELYGLTRADVLVACWWVGTYGKSRWAKQWIGWADDAYGLLAAEMWGRVSDPPTNDSDG